MASGIFQQLDDAGNSHHTQLRNISGLSHHGLYLFSLIPSNFSPLFSLFLPDTNNLKSVTDDENDKINNTEIIKYIYYLQYPSGRPEK